MSREVLVIILGIGVILVPELGIPSDWKMWFLYGAGALLIFAGYSLRRSAYLRSIEAPNGERETESYTESKATVRNETEVAETDV